MKKWWRVLSGPFHATAVEYFEMRRVLIVLVLGLLTRGHEENHLRVASVLLEYAETDGNVLLISEHVCHPEI